MKKEFLIVGFIFAALFIAVDSSFAAAGDMGTIAEGVKEQSKEFIGLFKVLSYVGALIFGIKGGLKLKEWSDSKGQQVPVSQPIWYLAIAGLLAALPSVLSSSATTIFGGNQDELSETYDQD